MLEPVVDTEGVALVAAVEALAALAVAEALVAAVVGLVEVEAMVVAAEAMVEVLLQPVLAGTKQAAVLPLPPTHQIRLPITPLQVLIQAILSTCAM
jgi:hypothetical protein